jgi:hypothetical protein
MSITPNKRNSNYYIHFFFSSDTQKVDTISEEKIKQNRANAKTIPYYLM